MVLCESHSSHAAPSDARKPDKSLLSSLIEQTQPSVVVKIVKLAIERFRDAFGISSASDGAVSAGHRQHAIAAQRVLCELVDALCNATSATRNQNVTTDVPARSLLCACV
jgi:predicted glycosyltransferase